MAFTLPYTPVAWGYDAPRATIADRACQAIAEPVDIDLTSTIDTSTLTAAESASLNAWVDGIQISGNTITTDYITTTTLRYDSAHTASDYSTTATMIYEPAATPLTDVIWNAIFKNYKQARADEMEDAKLNIAELKKSFDELMK